jgi:hypothetical protein
MKIGPLSSWIHIDADCNVDDLTCCSIKDADGKDVYVFLRDPDCSPYLIYNTAGKLKIRTPKLLKGLLGKDIIKYRQYVDELPNELFRIKRLSDVSQKNRTPYFTAGTLVLPWLYISQALDETASICRISFNATDPTVIAMGQIRAEVTLVKRSELWNYPLYKTSNGLTTRTISRVVGAVEENGSSLKDFHYAGTLAYDKSKFGIIVFKEKKQ